MLGALLLGCPRPAHAGASPATVHLYPVPRAITATCKATAHEFRIRVLCPTVLPRATIDLGLLPPPRVALFVEKGGRIFGGFSFNYGVPWSPSLSRARDSPAAFLHFELDRTSVVYFGGMFNIHQDARRVRLGGRAGWLRPADGSGPLYGNHVRFYFTFDHITWAATLHSYGPGTTALLGRLIRHLRVISP